MRTTWPGVPQELRDAATPLLEKHRKLLPDWVRVLTIRYDSEMTDAYAAVVSEPEQKRVTLTLSGSWASQDAWEREVTVIHELMHTRLAPIERAFEQIVGLGPKRTHKHAEQLIDAALEEVVSDLTHTIVGEAA